MKKILIRADGSKDIGMGHLSRCCLIANYFFDVKNIESVIIAYRNNAAENFLTLKNKAAKIHYLDIGSSIENELEIISSLVKSLSNPLKIYETGSIIWCMIQIS